MPYTFIVLATCLVLSSGCSVSAIRNAQATIGEIVKFMHASAMRTVMLTKAIGESAVQTKQKRLVSPSETRWVERHKAICCFVELFEPVVRFLTSCQDLTRESASKAHHLLLAISQLSFVISIVVMHVRSGINHKVTTDVVGALKNC